MLYMLKIIIKIKGRHSLILKEENSTSHARRSAETSGTTGAYKSVGAALVEAFAVIFPVEATTPLVDAPPDIGSKHGVCNA